MSETPATVKTVEHNEASRLPDTSWLWRRVLIFACVIPCLYIAERLSQRVEDPRVLREIVRYCFGIVALGLMLYGVGATVTDVAKLVTAFLSTKRVTMSSAPAPAVVTPERVDSTADPVEPEIDDAGELPADQRIA